MLHDPEELVLDYFETQNFIEVNVAIDTTIMILVN